MDGQLEAVRQDMRSVKDKIAEVKQGLAVAEHAHNALLLSLNNQLLSLQEEKNILLRSQAPSKPCIQLVHTAYLCSHHFARHSFLHILLLVCNANGCIQ